MTIDTLTQSWASCQSCDIRATLNVITVNVSTNIHKAPKTQHQTRFPLHLIEGSWSLTFVITCSQKWFENLFDWQDCLHFMHWQRTYLIILHVEIHSHFTHPLAHWVHRELLGCSRQAWLLQSPTLPRLNDRQLPLLTDSAMESYVNIRSDFQS